MVSRVSMARPSVQPAPAIKPSKPVLRTLSGTIRKYDEAGLDLPSTPSSPSKRARVTFNPTVEEKLLVEWSGRSVESVKKEVKRALEAHARNDSDDYDALKEVFAPNFEEENEDEDRNSHDKNKEMKTYLIALTSCVSILTKNCNGLVKVILACDWMGREEAFVKAYAHFLGNLASAQGAYVELILRMLVGHFYGGEFFCHTLTKT
jgi:RNA polymerase I-specific transcription initiation factor RRN3